MTSNIVLVTIDSLRADHCGFMDSTSELTPTLDEMANQGVVFENAVAPGPRTPSSMPSILTGEPVRPVSGETNDYWQEWRAHIYRHMRRHRPVAQRMQERGYETIGVSVNPWTENTGFDEGFAIYHQLNGENLASYGPPIFRVVDKLLRGNPLGEKLNWFNKREWFVQWTDYYDRIVKSVGNAGRPFFLWVFLLDTHQPYIAPRTFREEITALEMYYASSRGFLIDGDVPPRLETRLRRAYRDSVRSVDGLLSRLRHDLATEDPIFVVHADHGEGFGEHGSWGHEQALYRENLHVPLVVHNTGVQQRVTAPVSLRTIPKLITDLAGSERFDPGELTSSFVRSMTETWERQALTGTAWKYITDDTGTTELYHLAEDPDEATNLAAAQPEVVATLQSLLAQYQRHGTERETIARAVDDLELPA